MLLRLSRCLVPQPVPGALFAAFDRGGGYAHQFLLYRSGDSVVRESVTEFLERLRCNPTEQVGTLLPFAPVSTAEKVLVPVT